MQAMRGAGRIFSLLDSSLSCRSTLSSLTGWHASSAACTGPGSTHLNFLQNQLRTITQQPTNAGNQRVVILGTGWAAGRLLRDIDTKFYDVTVCCAPKLMQKTALRCREITAVCLQVVSPRNHMVYTPRLTSACVGTLDFRSVAVPIMALQKHLKDEQNNLFIGSCDKVDSQKKEVHCQDEDGLQYKIPYDKLVIATGSQVGVLLLASFGSTNDSSCGSLLVDWLQGSTFGIPGVDKYSHPLRDIKDANGIKNHLLANWSKANTPNRYWFEIATAICTHLPNCERTCWLWSQCLHSLAQ